MSVHLRIEDAGIGLNNLDSTIEGLLRVVGVALSNDSSEIQTKLLWMHVGLESIWKGLAFASWNHDTILFAGQVAHDASP